MASSGSTPNTFTFIIPNVVQMVATKLVAPNYMSWLTQFVQVIKTYECMGILDGSEPSPPQFIPDPQNKDDNIVNPAFIEWEKKDQFLLSWINSTLSENLLATIYGLTTACQVWTSLATKCANQSRSSINTLKR